MGKKLQQFIVYTTVIIPEHVTIFPVTSLRLTQLSVSHDNTVLFSFSATDVDLSSYSRVGSGNTHTN